MPLPSPALDRLRSTTQPQEQETLQMKQLPQPAPQHDWDSKTGSGDSSTKSKSNSRSDERDTLARTADSDDLLEIDCSDTLLLLHWRHRGGQSMLISGGP